MVQRRAVSVTRYKHDRAASRSPRSFLTFPARGAVWRPICRFQAHVPREMSMRDRINCANQAWWPTNLDTVGREHSALRGRRRQSSGRAPAGWGRSRPTRRGGRAGRAPAAHALTGRRPSTTERAGLPCRSARCLSRPRRRCRRPEETARSVARRPAMLRRRQPAAGQSRA